VGRSVPAPQRERQQLPLAIAARGIRCVFGFDVERETNRSGGS